MPIYEQYDADGNKVGRAFTVDGSDDDARHAALASSETGGWRRADNVEGAAVHGAAPTTPNRATSGRPRKNASVDVWHAWAVSNGMDPEQADDLTKNQLIELADQLDKE
ncbi:hypothetical protein [Nonomuraea sp. NPDC005650]|uniref:hypothetical protein n=1 Tax=Nonomuraea sp. NPDC005650 TaxID=3157045 RepID=UPI0033AEECE3